MGEVELVLECVAALRVGGEGINPLQVKDDRGGGGGYWVILGLVAVDTVQLVSRFPGSCGAHAVAALHAAMR